MKSKVKETGANNEIDTDLNLLNIRSDSAWNLFEMAVLAFAAAGLLYFGYFQLAPWIWSQNLPFRPGEIALWQLPWMDDRDGIELHALYAVSYTHLTLPTKA